MNAGSTATQPLLESTDRHETPQLVDGGNSTTVSVPVSPAIQILVTLSSALAALTALVRACIDWRSASWIDVPAGVLMSMAVDLRNGVFYRPLTGPAGFGGTRYFPLYFSLHAWLLKLGFPLLTGAWLLSFAAVVALIAGIFCLLRELGVQTWLAACGAIMILTSVSTHVALVSPHADGLACALNVWALVMLVRPDATHRRTLLAALLFTLAWSAKMTTVFGPAAGLIWLISTGRARRAAILFGETCCGYLLVAVTIIVASHGRFLEILRACVSGGAGWHRIAQGPAELIASARRNDPSILLFGCFALLALGATAWTPGRNIRHSLPALLFITTALVTIAIFGSPGTNFNHFLDLQVAAILLIVSWLAACTSREQKQLGLFSLALLTLVSISPPYYQVVATVKPVNPRRFQRVAAALPGDGKPILAENPIFPALQGQTPYVLDPWMFQMLRQRIPNFGEPLLAGLRNQTFGAVVLCRDPRSAHWQLWYDRESFGPGFVDALNQNYRLANVVDDQMIYLPISHD